MSFRLFANIVIWFPYDIGPIANGTFTDSEVIQGLQLVSSMLINSQSFFLISGKEDDKTLRLQTLVVFSNGLLGLRFDPGKLTEVSLDMSSDRSERKS